MNRCLPPFCIRSGPVATALYRGVVGCGLTLCFAAPVTMAQTAIVPAGAVPAVPTTTAVVRPKQPILSEKTSLTPNTQDIVAFIKENVARLADDDAETVSNARGDLLAGSFSTSNVPASVVYLDAYVGAVARELAALQAQKPSLRVKVNIGIVAAKVADNAKAILPATALQNVIKTLMQDPNDAVALWGMKAAAAVLTAPNQTTPNVALLRLILPTVDAHHLSGPITDEAYAALLDPSPPVIDTLINLYAKRVAVYKTGAIPQDPSVELRASAPLTTQSGMWSKLSVRDRQTVMNIIADLLSEASGAMGKKENVDSVDQLRLAITKACAAVSVVAGSLNNNDLREQAERASKLPSNASAATVVQVITPIVAAVRKAFPMTAAAGNIVPSLPKP